MVDTGTLVAIFAGACGVWAGGLVAGVAMRWVQRIKDAA
jgi:hypothetical protein